MKRRFLVLLATVIAVFSTATLALTASATPQPHNPGPGIHGLVRANPSFPHSKYITYYYWPESSVNGGNAGYVVDNPNNTSTNGVQQQIWTPNGGGQQGWYLSCFYSDCSYYWIINENGKCLDDTLGGTANGTKIQQWTCISGDTNQAWLYHKYSGPNGNYAMWVSHSGACIDDAHPYTDGGKLQMWQCDFPPNNDNAEAWQVPAATW